jgi:hypothetical protein
MLLIDTILLAAAAAGVEDAARIDALRVGGSARTAGSRQPGRVSEAAPLWPRAELAQLAGSHRVGAELARFAGRSASVPAEPTPFRMFAEVTAGAASLADAFDAGPSSEAGDALGQCAPSAIARTRVPDPAALSVGRTRLLLASHCCSKNLCAAM